MEIDQIFKMISIFFQEPVYRPEILGPEPLHRQQRHHHRLSGAPRVLHVASVSQQGRLPGGMGRLRVPVRRRLGWQGLFGEAETGQTAERQRVRHLHGWNLSNSAAMEECYHV